MIRTKTTAPLEIIGSTDAGRWLAVLAEIPRHDFYHLPGYHAIAEQAGAGEGRLLVYREAGQLIALPLLIRRCGTVAGLEGADDLDATSVYGYAGPISFDPNPGPPVIARFQAALLETLESMGVVSLYSSLHPLLDQASEISGLGEIVRGGSTVSIDLTLSQADQVGQYRSNHVRDIRKLRALGAQGAIETNGIDEFVTIYRNAMLRLGAARGYYFSDEYFAYLGGLMGSQVQLFSCVLDGTVIAGGLFLICGDVAQYHLGASRGVYANFGGLKVVLDTARQWASEAGLRVLHLGGGRGAQDDSLYHFKTGFSNRRHAYRTWRWVLDPMAYEALITRKQAWNAGHGEAFESIDYFPQYRAPTATIEPPESS